MFSNKVSTTQSGPRGAFGYGARLSGLRSVPTRLVARRGHVVISAATDGKMEVLVTGAGGKTGALVLKKLLKRDSEFVASALVRSEKSAEAAKGMGLAAENLHVADITESSAELSKAFEGKDAVIIATSGVPKLKVMSLLPFFWQKLQGVEDARPEFYFNQAPQVVDFTGQINQIEAAKAAGVKRVVLVSSMGGTNVNHPLNSLGDGNIVLWKRKAEQHLIDSGLCYTILHPGGLKDDKDGERVMIFGVDDELLQREKRSIPRGDVAQLCVQSLLVSEAANRSIDVIAGEPDQGEPSTTVEAIATLFKELESDCDYSIPSEEDVDKRLSETEAVATSA